MQKIVISLMAFVLPSLAWGAENFCGRGKPHDIDVLVEAKLGEYASNADIRAAQAESYRRWDDELNRVYRQLMSTLPENDRKLLRQAQSDWLTFRKSEEAWQWSDSVYGGMGSFGGMTIADDGRDRLRRRVCDLERYLDHRHSKMAAGE